MNKPIKIRLHVLSPIHIGCDDVYEPTSFVIDETRKKLIEFDPIEFVKMLKPQEMIEFTKTASGDNLLAIFKAIKRFYQPTLEGREVEVSDYLVAHYKEILDMPSFDRNAVINQFTMNKTAYNSLYNTPYIPGTSLKGALRTAYLSALANINKVSDWKFKADLLETKLLNRENGKEKMSSDPFRLVKISDLLPLENSHTKIFYAVNKKKKLSDKASRAESGPPQIFEAIKSGAIFEGTININMPERGANISEPIKKDFLLKAAQRFYSKIMKDDESLSHIIGLNKLSEQPHYTKFSDQFNKTVFLIRLGRHSGAEAVTIEENRIIRIMQGRGNQPKFLDHATTLWLASDEPRPKDASKLLPFGWAVLEMLPFDAKNIYPPRIQRISEADARLAEARRAAEEEAARKAAEKNRLLKIEEEKRQREAEEQRRKEELESLSEEERLIRIVEYAGTAQSDEQKVHDCFKRLDNLASPHKELLARAIKQYYLKINKWDGGSKKQVEKVKKLKAILGDGN